MGIAARVVYLFIFFSNSSNDLVVFFPDFVNNLLSCILLN